MSQETLEEKELRTPTSEELDAKYSRDFEKEKEKIDDLNEQLAENDPKDDEPEEKEPKDGDKQPAQGFVKKPLTAAKKSSGGRRTAMILGGSGIAVVLVVMLFLLLFLGQLKSVHFATVMRSAAFAAMQRTVSKIHGQILFDAATLTDSSTGRVDLGEKSLAQKLRLINPEKRLAQLGREGNLKFEMKSQRRWGGLSSTNIFQGVQVKDPATGNYKSYMLDDYAKAQFGPKAEFDSLSRAQQWRVQSAFIQDVRPALDVHLETKSLVFRSNAYNGLRRAAGIGMVKWVAAKYAGKNAREARVQNLNDTIDQVDKGDVKPGESGVVTDEEKQAAIDEQKQAIIEGRKAKPSPRIELTAKAAKNVSDIAFALTAACIINDLNTSFQQSSAEVQPRAMRFGHSILTTADQIAIGGENTPSGGVQADNEMWEGADNSAFYKQAIGEVPSEQSKLRAQQVPFLIPDPKWVALSTVTEDLFNQMNFGPIAAIFAKAIPGFNSALDDVRTKECAVITNQFVQYGVAGGEIIVTLFTLGTAKTISATLRASLELALQVGGLAAGEILGSLLDKTLQNATNLGYSGLEQGESRFNNGYVAVSYLADYGQRTVNYGRPVSEQDAIESQKIAMAEIRQQNNQKGFSERYFAIENPFSLVGNLAAKVPTTGSETVASFTNFISFAISILTSPFRILGFASGLSAHAYAGVDPLTMSVAGTTNTGFTEAELQRIAQDDSFSSKALLTSVEANLEDLDGKYEQCFTYIYQTDMPEECGSSVTDPTDGKKKGYLATSEALHYRWYKALGTGADEDVKDVHTLGTAGTL